MASDELERALQRIEGGTRCLVCGRATGARNADGTCSDCAQDRTTAELALEGEDELEPARRGVLEWLQRGELALEWLQRGEWARVGAIYPTGETVWRCPWPECGLLVAGAEARWEHDQWERHRHELEGDRCPTDPPVPGARTSSASPSIATTSPTTSPPARADGAARAGPTSATPSPSPSVTRSDASPSLTSSPPGIEDRSRRRPSSTGGSMTASDEWTLTRCDFCHELYRPTGPADDEGRVLRGAPAETCSRVTDGGPHETSYPRPDPRYYPRHPTKLARQARYLRAAGQDDAAEGIEAELHAAGRCRVCGRTLTDPVSIERGIGPDCARKAT